LPFIFFYIQKGVTALPFLNTSGSKTSAPNISAAILFLGCLLASLVLIYNNQTQFYSPETQHFRQACFWLKDNSPPDALVLSRNPRMAANWAHRKTWWYTTGHVLPQTTDRGIPISPTHILVSHYDIAGVTLADEFEKLMAKTPEQFTLVYKTAPPQVSVYAIQSQGP
jgi:hypothetical protein